MIFIDTGAFVARYIQRDQDHHVALRIWRRLEERRRRCFTTHLVFNETITLLARRSGYTFAAQRARAWLSSETVEIWRSSRDEDVEAVEVMEKYADQGVSFTDCVSFVLMRAHRLQDVFSFDSQFERAGFRLLGERDEP